jgi:hypothetical protein
MRCITCQRSYLHPFPSMVMKLPNSSNHSAINISACLQYLKQENYICKHNQIADLHYYKCTYKKRETLANTNPKPLRPPLDRRVFKEKTKDWAILRNRHCRCLWFTEKALRKSTGILLVPYVFTGFSWERNIHCNLFVSLAHA